MALDACVSCRQLTERGRFPGWAVLFAVLLFPLGMLFLLVGRNPTLCTNCDGSSEISEADQTTINQGTWWIVAATIFFVAVVVIFCRN